MRTFGGALARGVLAMAGRRSPWGGKDKDDETSGGGAGGGDGSSGDGDEPEIPDAPPPRGPRNPWLPPGGEPPPRRSASIEDIFRARERGRGGGSGGGGMPRIPRRPDGKSWFPLIVGAIVLLWLGVSTVHMVGPKEEGIVTTFGKYSRTITPGVSLSLPWPIENVEVTDVTSIRRDSIPENDAEKLMLTSDQNLVDLSYLVRWNIKDLKLYKFQLDDPDTTVKEVAEAAMRQSVAEVPLNAVIGGAGRGQIEQNVRVRMQALLDAYKAGVLVQGVELKKTDPPEKVVDAFRKVNVAQQEAERYQSEAQAWSQQVVALAKGEAAAFDKVYQEYKLAPEVTRRRMYYETMERVLRNNDKIIMEAQGVTPYLPLPQLKGRPATAPADAPAQGGQ